MKTFVHASSHMLIILEIIFIKLIVKAESGKLACYETRKSITSKALGVAYKVFEVKIIVFCYSRTMP